MIANFILEFGLYDHCLGDMVNCDTLYSAESCRQSDYTRRRGAPTRVLRRGNPDELVTGKPLP
jgi:hypothetical protein